MKSDEPLAAKSILNPLPGFSQTVQPLRPLPFEREAPQTKMRSAMSAREQLSKVASLPFPGEEGEEGEEDNSDPVRIRWDGILNLHLRSDPPLSPQAQRRDQYQRQSEPATSSVHIYHEISDETGVELDSKHQVASRLPDNSLLYPALSAQPISANQNAMITVLPIEEPTEPAASRKLILCVFIHGLVTRTFRVPTKH